MLDHIGLVVSDYAKSKAFFEKALAPLGYSCLMEFSGAAGFGAAGKPDFWISQGQSGKPPVHVAFAVTNRSVVDAFHKAALGAGGLVPSVGQLDLTGKPGSTRGSTAWVSWTAVRIFRSSTASRASKTNLPQ